MNIKWNIVCDSSSDLAPAQLIPGKLDLRIAPLTLLVDGESYVDDPSLDVDTLLAAMGRSGEAASTACPSPAAFEAAFLEADYTLCFTISGNLSGTYAAAVTARTLVLEAHPEKKIFVLDSCSTSGALILLARKAQALIASGNEDFEDICRQLTAAKEEQYTIFTLESFENLVKNGRMKPLLGTLLHTLGIHVIADATREGTIRVIDKARGDRRIAKNLVAHMASFKAGHGAEVVISHCKNHEGAVRLKEAILEALPVKSVDLYPCRGLTTFYAMEKGLIVVF